MKTKYMKPKVIRIGRYISQSHAIKALEQMERQGRALITCEFFQPFLVRIRGE